MEYIIEWSRLSDAAQFVCIAFLFYILASLATIVYVVCNAIRNAWNEHKRRKRIYYWRYTR